MIEPIKTLQIDIFDKKQSSEWKALKSKFFTQNEGIKVATKDLIDMLFRYEALMILYYTKALTIYYDYKIKN